MSTINVKQVIIGVAGVGAAVSVALEHFVQAGNTFFGISAGVLALVAGIFGAIQAAEQAPTPPAQ